MASEELATVHELLRGVDLDDLTIAGRRTATESVAAPPPPGTTVEPVDAGGVPAERVIAAGVDSVRALLYLHGGAYQIGSPARYVAADSRHPYASPLYADLHGLPPILIHVGDAEVILDDSTRFAAKACAAGVDVTLEVWDQMPHVWHAFAGLLPESDQAIERIGGWLQARCPRG